MITYFLNGHYNDLLKNEDPQKSIELNDEDPAKVKTIEELLNKLEQMEVSFKYCRLCECILTDPNAVQPSSTAWTQSEAVAASDKGANTIDKPETNSKSEALVNNAGSPATELSQEVSMVQES